MVSVRAAAAIAPRAVWLAHLRLHFAAPGLREMSRREELRRFAAGLVFGATWHNVTRHVATHRSMTAATQLHHTAIASTVVHGGEVAIRNAQTVTIVRHAPLSSLRRDVVVRGGWHSLREVHRSVAVSHERTHSSSDRLRELRVFRTLHAQSQTRRDTTVISAPLVASVPLVQPAQLVWRREPASGSESGHESRRIDHFVSSPSSRSSMHDAPGRAVAQASRAALQANAIDPALLDRLTDDVIRRVERRARIERERRGL
jgi:hypothetical protein